MYPQTSCPCGNCPSNILRCKFKQESRPDTITQPSSLGIPNCTEPACFKSSCTTSQTYAQNIQPTHPNKPNQTVRLNPLGVTYDSHYTPVHTSMNGPCATAFRGTNPKLIDPPRNQTMLLDRPNFVGEVGLGFGTDDIQCVDQIYSPVFNSYGKGYKSYQDINAGQIQYYISTDHEQAYFNPNFTSPAVVNHSMYQDPMGVVRPEYSRASLKPYSWNACASDRDCDSRTHDALEFRQELMEKQMRKQNEQRYSPRWAEIWNSSSSM